ncbi:MAG: PIG-L family deacetylase [Planctomycetes bacterium]|nr:PIG-L family deacetylase [Planctomycetota bacterium]
MRHLSLCGPSNQALRILCLGAHCDDIEIGCGGTILTLLKQYANAMVRWVVFSSSTDRAHEARESAAAFLAEAPEKEIVVNAYRDGFFPYVGAQIKDDFEALKRDFDPDLVLTHYRDDRHQDHRTISDLTWNTFRDHLILEYEIPKYDGDMGAPNFFVPLEEATCRTKTRIIIESFRSQRQKHWFDEHTFMAILRLRGMEANSPTRYAEGFYSRKAVLE